MAIFGETGGNVMEATDKRHVVFNEQHQRGIDYNNATLAVAMDVNPKVIDLETFQTHGIFELTGTPAEDDVFAVPQHAKVFTVFNTTAERLQGKVTLGAVLLAIEPGELRQFRSDGVELWPYAAIASTAPQATVGRELSMNGAFDLWKRGPTFTESGYNADRWRGTKNAGDSVTWNAQEFSLGQTNVPGEPERRLRVDKTVSVGSAELVEHRMEGIRTAAAAPVTVSYYAKIVAPLTGTAIPRMRQFFGTGGAPSASVDTDAAGEQYTDQWVRYAHTFNLPSLSGKTIGTDNNDYVSFILDFPDENFTFDIWGVSIRSGVTTVPYEKPDLTLETDKVKRYYECMCPVQAPLGISMPAVNISNSLALVSASWREKRAIPTVIFGTPGDFILTHGGGNSTVTALAVRTDSLGPFGCIVEASATGLTNNGASTMHANLTSLPTVIVDAEL